MLPIRPHTMMSHAMSSLIMTLRSPSLKLEKVFAIQLSPLWTAGLETIMNPISEAKIRASNIRWVANIYMIKNIAGTSEKIPGSALSEGSMLVRKTVASITAPIANRVRFPLKSAFSCENIFNNYHLSFRSISYGSIDKQGQL